MTVGETNTGLDAAYETMEAGGDAESAYFDYKWRHLISIHDARAAVSASTQGLLERLMEAFDYMDAYGRNHFIDIVNDVEKITYKGYHHLDGVEVRGNYLLDLEANKDFIPLTLEEIMNRPEPRE